MPYQFPQLLGALSGQRSPPALDSRLMGPPQYPQLPLQQGPPTELLMQQRPTQAYNSAAQQLRALYPDPRSKSLASHIGSIALPALFAGLAGGSGRDMLLYGAGSAAYNFNNELEDFRDIEAKIAEAGMRLPQEESEYDVRQAQQDYYKAQAEAALDPALGGSQNFSSIWNTYVAALGPSEKPSREGFLTFARELTDAQTREVQPTGSYANYQADIASGAVPPSTTFEQWSQRIAQAGGYGRQAGKTTADAGAEAVAGMETASQAISQLSSLESRISELPTGPIIGPVLGALQTDYMSLRSAMVDAALSRIGVLKSQGVSLNPITERELAILMSTSTELANTREANLEIIRRLKSQYERTMGMMNARANWISSGKSMQDYRPPAPGQPVPTAPSAPPQMAPDGTPYRPGDVIVPESRGAQFYLDQVQ